MNEQASAWLTAVDGLPAVHTRLRRVVILNRPAMDVIPQQDGPQTCFYLDPPYVPFTRVALDAYGLHEMSAADHEALLRLLLTVKGKVLLSGYRSGMYDEILQGWARHDFDLPNNAAGGGHKRRMTECLWLNYRVQAIGA
jgi:DNA adenine methylase